MRTVIVLLFAVFGVSGQVLNAQKTVKDCDDNIAIWRSWCLSNVWSLPTPITTEFKQHPSFYAIDGTLRTDLEINCYYQDPTTGKTIFKNSVCQGISPGIPGPPIIPNPPKCPVVAHGSVIRPEEGSVAEDVEIVGTRFKLVYTSQRTLGNSKTYKFPISTNTTFFSPDYIRTDFTINYSNGRSASYSFGLNQSTTFIWDGKNASGDYTEGPAYTHVESLDIFTSGPFGYTVGNTYSLGTWNVLLMGIGGWNFDIHHRYDPASKKIYLGGGAMVDADYELDGSTYRVVAEDGNEVYYFNTDGRHLTTNNARTNAVLYTFNYLSNGYLSSIVDAYGNTTSVLRNFSGDVTGIQSPYGQVTSLSLGVDGYLASIQNPKGETHSMTYYTGGLLHTFQKPRGQVSTMTYDSEGNLTLDSSSAGNYTAISTDQTSAFDKVITVSDFLGVKSTIALSQASGIPQSTRVERSNKTSYVYYDSYSGFVDHNNVGEAIFNL